MATITKRIDANNNSAQERSDDSNFGTGAGGTIVTGRSGASGGIYSWNSAHRFPGIAIPQGATITSAKITFTSSENSSDGSYTTNIYGEDVDNAVDFGSNADLMNRTRTTAVQSWGTPASLSLDGEYDTADITSLVQEIVDRVGWSSGNAMCFLLIAASANGNVGTDNSHFPYEASTTKAPLLTIVYSSAVEYTQAVDATVTATASMLTPKTIVSALTATATGTASVAMIKDFIRTLEAGATATASVLKGLSQALTATVTTSAILEASRAYLQALTATVSATASLAKVNVWARTISAAVTATGTLARVVTANIAMTADATITATMDLVREITLTAVTTVTASVASAIGKSLTATVSIIAKVSAPFWRTKYPTHGDGDDYEIKYPHE